jgi:hypothetical protein
VNLIPYNPISEVDYQRPSDRQIQGFVDELTKRHVAVSVRYSRGLEKDAACGQLRAQKVASQAQHFSILSLQNFASRHALKCRREVSSRYVELLSATPPNHLLPKRCGIIFAVNKF